ncbi:MAG: alpha-glucosidase [Ruminococcus sp.]|nr:alpha-glucosidase [Ruminococcus sp.]
MEKKWWKESVVYQIYPRSFCDSNGDGIGDLKGITSRLDYLKELGIDVIWLSPVYQSPNDDNGYDISDYQAVMEEFGTMEDFDEMLAAAHKHDIKLVMDLVVNHTSDEHRWFVESRKSVDNPYRDYYIWRPAKDGKEPNNWGSCFSGPAWEYDPETDMYYLHLFSKKQPDLNWDNPVVREEVFQMMNWWLDKGVDGFRMDVISLISKKPDLPDGVPGINGYASFNEPANGPRVHEYLQEMRQKVLDRADTITVGECSGVTLEEAKKYARSDGKELNMVFQFEHMDVDADGTNKWSDKKMDLRDLKEVMTKWQKGLEDIAWNSLFWENHDQPRCVSRFGNNGVYREASAKMLATCLYMMQGTPYIYQGQELGMTNVPFENIEDFRDLDSINAYYELTGQGVFSKEEMMRFLRYKSRDNARTPFQWNDKENAGFTSGTPWIMVNPNYKEINAEEQLAREDSVFHYFQKLIRLRKEHEVIVYGTYDLLLPDSKEIYAYTRTLGEQKLLVVCSFSAEQVDFEIPAEFLKGEILIQNYAGSRVPGMDGLSSPESENVEQSGHMTLRPYEAIAVLL